MADFYTNVAVSGKFILYRGVEGDKRVARKIAYQPTFYVPSKEKTDFTTLGGEYVQEFKPGDIPECREFIKRYEGVETFPIYGNSRYEYAFIGEKFPDDILWDVSKVKIAYIDIEVGSESGFPNPKDANEVVTAITIRLDNKCFVFGCGEFQNQREDVLYAHASSEKELLSRFLDLWTLHYPDVVSGWNIKTFDIPYLVNRIEKILGENEVKKLSPWGRVDRREAYFMNRTHLMFELSGIATLDYIELYRKFTYSQQESYSLNHIAHVELGEKKINYDEYENLHQLYKNNYQKFIEYNIKDVELVVKLEDKLKLVELALTLAYDNKVNYDDVFTQVRMWDAIVYNYLKRKNIVIPQISRRSKSESYEGAYVKEPILGLHKWVVSFDLDSLYPHLIMQYNISMETLLEHDEEMKQFLRDNPFVGVEALLKESVDTTFLHNRNITLTPNWQFFSREKRGILPEIMDTMYKDRVQYKKMALDAKKKMQTVLDDKNQVEYLKKQIARYNNLQLAKKVTLNSAYGALGNEFFRFFDIRIATAITTAGQLSIRWIEKRMNAYLNNLLKTENEDYVLASDTDSIYLDLSKLVGRVFKDTSDTKKIIDFLDTVCRDKLQKVIDDSYKELANYVNAYEQRMSMKRESLADKAIWTAKKHYILNVHDSEGVRYAEPSLKILGLEAIKSSTPSACREKIKQSIKIIMNGTEEDLHRFVEKFKTEFTALPVEDIAFPRSVNGLKEYEDSISVFKKGTPIHVKGALVYNQAIEKLNLTKRYQTIQEGEKIKFVYLKQPNPFKNNTLAFLSVLPKQLNAEAYIDYDTQFQKSFLDPLAVILATINWSAEQTSTLDDFFS